MSGDLLESDHREEHRPADRSADVARLILAIDAAIGRQLDKVLHHPDFQRLEALWRGASWLADAMATDPQLKLRILDVRWAELARDAERATNFDRSVLFDKVYNEEFGRPGGEPFGMLVVDHAISHKPTELERVDDIAVLSALSEVAAAAFCPISLGVDPTMLGIDSFEDMDLLQDVAGAMKTPALSRFQRLRTKPDCRFLVCALPKLLMRGPHRGYASPRMGVRYDEAIGGHDDLLWGSAAFAMAYVAARAMRLHRWPANIRGAPAEGDGGLIDGPARIFAPSDRPRVVPRFPTDNAVSEAQEVDLNMSGMTALRQCHLTGSAAFFNVPSLHEPAAVDGAAARVNARMSAMTNYVLCVCRFAHYIKVIAREWVGAFTSAEDCQRKLENWIREYVSASDDAGPEQRARYPLRDARIDITERPEAPGVYNAVVAIRPHFQLDQLSSEFRLTTEIGRNIGVGMMQSLLDRLLDDAPDSDRDPALSDGELFNAELEGLKRDLEGLLNACRPYPGWAADGHSVIAFGLADITTEDFSSNITRVRIGRQIVGCIKAFEPRLSRVEVEFDPAGSPTPGVRFTIRALLAQGGEMRPVEYGARACGPPTAVFCSSPPR